MHVDKQPSLGLLRYPFSKAISSIKCKYMIINSGLYLG